MVFLKRVVVGSNEYFYLFHAQHKSDNPQTFTRFLGKIRPSDKDLLILEKKFLSDINKKDPSLKKEDNPNIIASLQKVQSSKGFIGEVDFIRLSKELSVPVIDLVGVATFYSQFKLSAPAKYKLQVCDGTACHVRGASGLLDLFEKEMGLLPGEASSDNLFSLDVVRCLGLCASAPLMMINEKLYPKLTLDSLKKILGELKEKK